MTTNFPTSLDTLVNPIASDDTSVVSHADQHANANDAIEALQEKVGANSSGVTTSHDYKIAQLESDSHTHSNKAVLDATTASFTTEDETKLDGMESGATADQTASEIKVAYESNTNTNAFTDAEKTLLGNQSGTNTGDQDLSGYVQSVTAGSNVTIDNTDPQNPIVSSTASGGGGGDMEASTYDPNTVAGDAFDMDNMVEGATTKILTDTERAAIAANTLKVTNATHTGDVTGDTALTISDDAVTFDKIQNIATNRVLARSSSGNGSVEDLTLPNFRTLINVEDGATANDTDANLLDRTNHTGTQVAATISDFDTEVSNNSSVVANTAKVGVTTEISNVVEDTTPQLGGDLDAQSNNLNTVGDIDYTTSQATVSALGNLGASQALDWSTATHFTGTLDSNVTVTHSNEVSGQSITLYLSYSGAQRTITWSDVDTWLDSVDGSAPAAPITTGDVLVVTLQYVGTTCYASATGNYAAY